jgi:glucosylceramidase
MSPDGSTVLVAHNENDAPRSFSVSENGQSFDYTLPGGAQVDLGRVAPLARFVLDTGASMGDYPRGYSVSVSTDGATRGAPVASGTGPGQLTTVELHGVRVRYVRVTLTATSSSWWSVADVRAYVRN